MTGEPQRKPPRALRRLLLLAVSVLVSLLLAEGLLRWLAPAALFVEGRDTEGWTENTPTFDAYMRIDAANGYVPLPGTMLYDERGLCRDQPKDQSLPTGASRVLWLGDSVTARRFVEREVRRQSAQPFTSWCGGVEGYNVDQSLGYFRTVLRPLRPDAVVFMLHHNDWLNTPLVFYDDQKRVHCRTIDREVAWFSPWLFHYSYIYRLGLSWLVSGTAVHAGAVADAKVSAALRNLRDLLAADGVAFTVLVLPPMLATEKWSTADRQRHAQALSILSELGIRHVDLLPGLQRALQAGVDPQQLPNDWMHPSEAVAKHLADDVVRAGGVLR